MDSIKVHLLVLGLACSSSPARAEVGVIRSAKMLPPNGPYVLSIITDDPDPIDPAAWRRMYPPGGARDVLNDAGEANGDGRPTLLHDPILDHARVAWSRANAGNFDVVLSRHEGIGWSEPVVLAGTSENELDPHLVWGEVGTVHLFYWVDGQDPRVMHRQAPADLSSWSVPVRVSAPGEAACRPAGAMHQGDLFVSYEVHTFGFGETPRQIVLARKIGDTFTPQIVANTHYADTVWAQVHSHAGRLWVDWVDSPGEIAWTRQNVLSQWEPIQYQPYANYEQREFLTRGAIRLQAIAP